MIEYQSLSGGFNILSDIKCSFFGHRKIEITEELKQKVKEVIEDLIVNHNVLIFLFGSRSDFDYLCHLVVTELKEKYPNITKEELVYILNSKHSEGNILSDYGYDLEKDFYIDQNNKLNLKYNIINEANNTNKQTASIN